MSKIGILGGSFNPPHVGHSEICNYLLGKKSCDKILLIPCYRHPFGKELASFDDRFNMLNLAFDQFADDVIVSDIEKRLRGTSYTVRTVETLKHNNPKDNFYLIVGSDISEERQEWKNFDKIEKLIGLIEVPRGEDSPITDISSTEIREMIKNGRNYERYVEPEVARYIRDKGLYSLES